MDRCWDLSSCLPLWRMENPKKKRRALYKLPVVLVSSIYVTQNFHFKQYVSVAQICRLVISENFEYLNKGTCELLAVINPSESQKWKVDQHFILIGVKNERNQYGYSTIDGTLTLFFSTYQFSKW